VRRESCIHGGSCFDFPAPHVWFTVMKSPAIVILILALLAGPASAAGALDFTCPVDGTRWKQAPEIPGRVLGLRLDLKKLGTVAQPLPLPQCPRCRLVLFQTDMAPELVRRLKAFVTTPDYRQIAARRSTYLCLAQIEENLAAPPRHIAHAYLRASWQLEDRPGLHRAVLTCALEKFNEALATMSADDPEIANTGLLCGELERRLGLFEQASRRFASYRDADGYQQERIQQIILRQMGLIAQRDSAPHAVQESEERLIARPAEGGLIPEPIVVTPGASALPEKELKPRPKFSP
jgi:hypothetical protein